MTLKSFFGFRFVTGLIGLLFGSLYTFIGLPFALFVLMSSIGRWLLRAIHLAILFSSKATRGNQHNDARFPRYSKYYVASGVSLDGALGHVTSQLDGPLCEEIDRFNKEVQLGVQRNTAYKSLMDRNSSKELQSLVNALIQGSSLGVAVARIFKLQAEDLRITRGFTAKEKAAKANPLVTLVTTFFIAPAVFGFIMGLIVLNIIYNPEAFGLDAFMR